MAQPTIQDLQKQIDILTAKLGKKGIDVISTNNLQQAEIILKGLTAEAESLSTTFGDITTTLKNIVSEISKGDSAVKDTTKAYKGLTSVAQKLQYEEEGIYSYNVKQLKNLQDQTKSQIANLKEAMSRLSHEEKINLFGENYLEVLGDQLKTEEILNNKIQERLNLEKKVEKTFGATGALIEGSGKLLSTMGFGHLSSELSDLNDQLKSELRDELDKSGGSANKLALSFKYMGKGLAGSAKIFADGLTDPLFIVGKILDTYLEINKASVDVQRLTGQNAVTAASWNTGLATAKDYLETISELTKQTGMNAQNVFSKDVIAQAAELKTVMGLTAEEAGGIALMAQTSNKSVRDITSSVVATTSAFNKTNRSAVSQGQVLRDVANTADSIKLSLGNNDVAIAKAAAAARRLGMDLARVDEIAGSLMNFEDSIGKELEAELLTGKQLNLEKARELALTNDLEGLSKELFKNSSDIAEFGKMNRIQQESYAAALGMTRDELAKMAYNKAIEAGMTEEQAAAAAKVNAEDMKRVAAQENFAKALDKIAGALAPILDIVGDILSMPLVPYLILGAAAIGKIGGGLISSVKSMGSLAKGALDFVKNLNPKGMTQYFAKLKDAFGKGLEGKAKETVADKAKDAISGKAEELGDKVGGVGDKTKGLSKGAGQGIKGFFQSLGEGFVMFAQAMATPTPLGPVGVVMAVSLAVITGAIIGLGYALGLAAPGIEAFGKVVTAAFNGLATMITAVADGFVKILGAVTMDNIMPMLLLGPALFGVAAGLAAVSLAGLAALPAIGGLVLLSKAAPALVSLGIGAGEKTAGAAKGKGEESQLEKKIGELITVLNREQTININIDGGKVATATIKHGPKVQTATS